MAKERQLTAPHPILAATGTMSANALANLPADLTARRRPNCSSLRLPGKPFGIGNATSNTAMTTLAHPSAAVTTSDRLP